MQIEPLEGRRHFAATLEPGVSYLTGIRSAGVQKNWSIDLVKGQALVLSASDAKGNSLTTELILKDPNGRTLNRAIGENGSFLGRVAPMTGRYTVRLRDLGGDDTGSVKITAFWHEPNIVDGDDAFDAQSGRRRAAHIDPGDLDVWSIDATQGQFISVLAAENDVGNAVGLGVLLVGPDGRGVANQESETGVNIDLENATAGRYYAVVYEKGANSPDGAYGISFAQTPGTQYAGDPDTATPLSNGVSRNGDLPGGDMDVWGIDLSAGDSFSATLTRGTGSLDPELLLVSPSGSVLSSVNGSTTTTLNFTIPSNGTYWLIGRDREADDGGQFSIVYTAS